LGATRIYVKDEEWQNTMGYLISISQLVVIHAEVSKGLEWELEAAQYLLPPEKLFISFLAWQELEASTRQGLYERFKRHVERIVDCKMPETIGDATFMYFESDWTGKPIPIFNKLIFRVLPVATIRESLRPLFKKRNLKLRFIKTFLEVLKSLMLIVCGVLILRYYHIAPESIIVFILYLMLFRWWRRRRDEDNPPTLKL
jgi:hypothetical protein